MHGHVQCKGTLTISRFRTECIFSCCWRRVSWVKERFHPRGWLYKTICWPAPWENCSNKQEASSQRRERGTFFVEYWQLGENKKSWNVIPGDPVEWRQRDRSWPGNPPALLALPCQGTGWLLPGLSQIQKKIHKCKYTNASTQTVQRQTYTNTQILSPMELNGFRKGVFPQENSISDPVTHWLTFDLET